jgi:hypothetical protein
MTFLPYFAKVLWGAEKSPRFFSFSPGNYVFSGFLGASEPPKILKKSFRSKTQKKQIPIKQMLTVPFLKKEREWIGSARL